MIPTAVWGTGNVGRAAIRMIDSHPELELAAVVVSTDAKVGADAGRLASLDRPLGVAATTELPPGTRDVVYAASADFRPGEALEDILACLRSGASVVSPGISIRSTTRSRRPPRCGVPWRTPADRAAARSSRPASIPAGATTSCRATA